MTKVRKERSEPPTDVNCVMDYVDVVLNKLEYCEEENIPRTFPKDTIYRDAFLCNGALAALIECEIPPGDVAEFINSALRSHGDSYPGCLASALLINPNLHRLVALSELAKDEDEFCRNWELVTAPSVFPRVWKKKRGKG